MAKIKYDIDRQVLQDVFCDRLNRLGFDCYGHFDEATYTDSVLHRQYPGLIGILNETETNVAYTDEDGSEKNMEYHIPLGEKGTVIIRPYYWGDKPSIEDKPNFEVDHPMDKDQNIQLFWYKYALRAAYSSRPLNNADSINELFDEIESHLVQSL